MALRKTAGAAAMRPAMQQGGFSCHPDLQIAQGITSEDFVGPHGRHRGHEPAQDKVRFLKGRQVMNETAYVAMGLQTSRVSRRNFGQLLLASGVVLMAATTRALADPTLG